MNKLKLFILLGLSTGTSLHAMKGLASDLQEFTQSLAKLTQKLDSDSSSKDLSKAEIKKLKTEITTELNKNKRILTKFDAEYDEAEKNYEELVNIFDKLPSLETIETFKQNPKAATPDLKELEKNMAKLPPLMEALENSFTRTLKIYESPHNEKILAALDKIELQQKLSETDQLFIKNTLQEFRKNNTVGKKILALQKRINDLFKKMKQRRIMKSS